MKITETTARKIILDNLDRLDPVTIYAENFHKGAGKITITCYGKAWTAYWGGMGDDTLEEFFCSCDEHYIAKNLSNIDAQVFDADKINKQAARIGKNHGRDDPWNDWDLMAELYGPDMFEWSDLIPKKRNHEYEYLCRIIKAVQDGFRQLASQPQEVSDCE